MDKKTYRIDEVADIFEVSRRTIQREIERKHLEIIHVGKQIRITREDLDAYQKKNVTGDDS